MQRLFEPLRDDDPLPPSTVDIGRAVRAGRRRIRVRWASVGTVVLAVLAVVVPVVSHTAVSGPPAGPVVRQESGAGFDPLRRVITVGDVPGTSPLSYVTARRWQRYSLKVGTGGFAEVVVYVPGWQATYATGGLVRPEAGKAADPVAGRRTYWLDRTLGGQQGPMLVWEWASGAWAYVVPQGSRSEQPDKDTMHRIAEAVVVSKGEQVTMPFTVPSIDGSEVVGTMTQIRGPGDPFVRTGLVFDSEHPGDPDRYPPHQRGFLVSVENGWKVGQKFGADRELNGHPALVVDGQTQIFGLTDGFAVDVQGAGSHNTLSGIAMDVRLVPAPSDRSTWVTKPVR